MKPETNYSTLVTIIKKRFKLFLIVGVAAIVVSSVVSSPFFITPKFKSDAAVYPSNLIKYSDESPTEQLLQLLQGNDIRDSVIRKFDLAVHYDIDTASEGSRFRLYREFDNNVNISKTNFESVNIDVLDKDPVQARDIVNELISQVNVKINLLHKEKAQEVVQIWRDQLNLKGNLIDTLEAQIKRYSTQYGLLDYTQQSREVTAGYMNMLYGNKQGQPMKKAEELYDNLKKEGRHFHDLHHQLNLAREDYNRMLINYESALKDVNKKLTFTNVVVYPEVADKKYYPVRWLIVVLSLIGSLVFTLVLILFYDQLKSK
ncbi:MAG: hypothetical protein KDD41_09580 [Flavobacteriales bacterium]|nr:hypothetical protein [Flavobacteriales bacterium]